MELKASVKTVFRTQYYDVEELIVRIYGKPYQLLADMEASNDSTIEINGVDGSDQNIDKYDIKEFKETGRYKHILGTLMNDLCKNGLIDKGDYSINVCW